MTNSRSGDLTRVDRACCVGRVKKNRKENRTVLCSFPLTMELSSMESKLITVTWKKTVVGFPVPKNTNTMFSYDIREFFFLLFKA